MSNLLEQSSKNQIHIDEFVDSLGVLSQSRKRKYRVTLGKISRELGEFTGVDQKKLKEYIIEKNESSLSDHTKRDYRLVLKKFFGWLVNREFVSWIRVGNVKGKVGPEDILTADELERVRYQCKLIRDRAIVETLYERARARDSSRLRGSVINDTRRCFFHGDLRSRNIGTLTNDNYKLS